ncbi:MAG: hypothetical protein ACOX4O_02785 [Eubacteriales bacterium]|jgi:ABC-type glycerol-3-phosphate transport system substrate-binding protein
MSGKISAFMFRLTAVLLLLCIIFASVSCGAENDAENAGSAESAISVEAAAAETTAAETTTEDYLAKFDDVDISGRTFRIIAQDTRTRYNFYHEDTAADIINDSINDRDNKVREKLGVEFEFIAYEDRGILATVAQKTILAGDDAYDMIITSLSAGINSLASAGVLFDLRQIPALTLDSELWNPSMYKNMELNGKQLVTTGNVSAQYLVTPIVVLFNKRLAEDFGIEDLYQTVNEGKWTIDRMKGLFADLGQDLDGNGKMDKNDFYGLSVDATFGNALYAAAGLNTIAKEGDNYYLSIDSKESVDLIERCAGLFGDRSVVYNDRYGEGVSAEIFRKGNALFLDHTLLGTIELRDMEDDFGIIPVPKSDESIDKYYAACNTWLPSGISVPKTCTDVEFVGTVMETMAYYSKEYMMPACYEVTLKGKVSRDEVFAVMLDLIYENTSYDFITIFNFSESAILLREAMLGETPNFVSKYEKIKDKVQSQLNNLVAIAG